MTFKEEGKKERREGTLFNGFLTLGGSFLQSQASFNPCQ
jgi:hypothetical protein